VPPQAARRVPSVPENVQEQLVLWECEAQRVRAAPATMYSRFEDAELFEAARQHAADLRATLWESSAAHLLVVQRGGEPRRAAHSSMPRRSRAATRHAASQGAVLRQPRSTQGCPLPPDQRRPALPALLRVRRRPRHALLPAALLPAAQATRRCATSSRSTRCSARGASSSCDPAAP
jgi:hypothetical protein